MCIKLGPQKEGHISFSLQKLEKIHLGTDNFPFDRLVSIGPDCKMSETKKKQNFCSVFFFFSKEHEE